jgi:hypothetical protein
MVAIAAILRRGAQMSTARMVSIGATLTALILAGFSTLAYADGDPPSDFLVSQRVFVPFHAPRPRLKQELIALAFAAKRDRFPIRIAVIQAKTDLGAVSQLYGKPRTYARFLGAELLWIHKNSRLLVVMRQGYGYTRAGHPIKGSDKTVALLALPRGNSSDQLTQAAITAVQRLAAAAGHRLPLPRPDTRPVPARPSGSFVSQNRTTLAGVLITVEGMCVAALILLFSRRRRSGGSARAPED